MMIIYINLAIIYVTVVANLEVIHIIIVIHVFMIINLLMNLLFLGKIAIKNVMPIIIWILLIIMDALKFVDQHIIK